MATQPTRIEVWPVAADHCGIWLCSDMGASHSDALPRGRHPSDEAKSIAMKVAGGELASLRLLHSTSWRHEEHYGVILTFIAVLDPGDRLVRERWPKASPISVELLRVVGNPAPHGPIATPLIRYVDVLYHAIRHLRFLTDTDDTAREALTEYWRDHLRDMAPVLAGMYQRTPTHA